MIRTRILSEKEGGCSAFSIDDRIFLGEGLFETLRVEDAMPCCADLHWQRLSCSAKKLGIPFDLSFELWLEYLLLNIKRANLYAGGIKVILSGGSAPRGLVACGKTSQLMIQTFTYTVENHPLRLVSSSWLRDATNPIYQVKSVNYLEAILARRQAIALGVDDALFFNVQGYATETTSANLFLVQKDCLLTPPLTDGVLPGITRSRLLKFTEQQNIGHKETSLTQTVINEADALFVTNSLQGIRPISFLDGVIFPVNNPLLNQLISSFPMR